MLCNNSVDSSPTLISKAHRPKITVSNKTTDDNLTQSKKLTANALINRGGGDCATNDILNRDFSKMKLGNGEAMMVLLCEKNSLPFEARFIPLVENTQCTIGRTSSKCRPSDSNAYFECKVLSRNQAIVWFDDEHKFWIKDTQSSNGTFLNGSKLNDEALQLHSGDIIQLGVNVYENKCSEVHNCIVACVQLYLPKILPKIVEESKEYAVVPTCPKILPQQPHCSNVDEQERGDSCETSRTTVECDVSEKVSKSAITSSVGDTAQRICLNFKDEQTDKPIQVELHTIQSFIEAIHNSRLDAWESISKEDSYLHRIFMLQNKINILTNGISEEALEREKQQWENEKQLYKRTAKDAIRRVGLECKEITLKIEQVESKYKSIELECDTLRDQIDAKDQSINDFSCLLRHIEMDYDEYKTEMGTKNTKLNDELRNKYEQLMNKIQALEIERDNLSRKLEGQEEFVRENVESNCEVVSNYDTEEVKAERCESNDGNNDESKEKFPNQRLAQLLEKLQELHKILQCLEDQDDYEDKLKIDQKTSTDSINVSLCKRTFAELYLQYKQLQMLLYKEEHTHSEYSTISVDLVEFQFEEALSEKQASLPRVKSTKSTEITTKEASEQTIESFDFDCFEAQIDDLQAQLIEHELCTEQLRDLLENECEMQHKKLSELQQENSTLLLQQEMAKSQPPPCIEVNIERNNEKDVEALFREIKVNLSIELQEKQEILCSQEKQLEACKQLLNEVQGDTLKLQTELTEITSKQEQQEQQQKLNTLPIFVPIFLGLIGMCVYVALKFLAEI